MVCAEGLPRLEGLGEGGEGGVQDQAVEVGFREFVVVAAGAQVVEG